MVAIELPPSVISFLDSGLESIYALQPIFDPTVILVPGFVKNGVYYLVNASGIDYETISYVIALFLCYPLGLIMNSIPHGQTRHVFSFLLGAFLMQFTVGVQWIHQLITSLVAYAMFILLPRSLSKKLVPAFVLMYLVFGHLHRQYINYLGWDLDFTGAQMVLTQKLWMMAYNLYDGELLAKGVDSKAAKKCEKYAMKDMPNFFEFMGYTFCFANVLAGPAYEYTSYRDACSGSLLYDEKGNPRGKIPSNVWPTLKPLLLSLFYLGVFFTVGANFPILDPIDPQKNPPVLLQPEFLAKAWYIRWAYTFVGLYFHRHKYYFGWKNAEGANNIWYAGFEGFDDKGEPKGWEISNNVDVFEFETSANLSTLTRAWNKKTSLWLNRYVYIRTNGSLLAVYSLSAFWHGFYPGYYLFFLSVPILTVCERLGKKKISPHFPPGKWTPYGVVCIALSTFSANYMVTGFVLLALDRTWALWRSYYFAPHILCVLFYAIVSQIPKPRGDKEKTKKVA